MQTQLSKLDNLKSALEKEGFKTSWIDPFRKWQRPDLYDGKVDVKTGGDLYVLDPPVSWIVPFDLAVVSIRLDDQGIYFELSFYYVDIMEDQTEASVFNAICRKPHYADSNCLIKWNWFRNLWIKWAGTPAPDTRCGHPGFVY